MTDVAWQDWTDAAAAAFTDVAGQALGLGAAPAPGNTLTGVPDLVTALVPLTSSDTKLQIGIVTDHSGFESMSRALLGMATEDAFESAGDVTDAFGEIANMVAGGVKTRMNDRVPGIQVGLPLCVQGVITTSATEHVVSDLVLGDARARIILLRSDRAETSLRPRG